MYINRNFGRKYCHALSCVSILDRTKNWSFGCILDITIFFDCCVNLTKQWIWCNSASYLACSYVPVYTICIVRTRQLSKVLVEYGICTAKEGMKKDRTYSVLTVKREDFSQLETHEDSTFQLIRILAESYASRILRLYFPHSPSYEGC